MINKVTLVGNLGKDPEIRHLENGSVVAKLVLATNENYRDKNEQWQTITEWHTVVAWRGLATYSEKSLKKGSLAYIEGKITNRKWQDKEGNDRYNTEIVASSIRSLDRKESSDNASFKAASENLSGPVDAISNKKTVEKTDDDDLPF